ncbi:MAG: potassium channel family protein [Micromonosporaceae bacterium]
MSAPALADVRREAWERRVEVPLTVAAMVFLAAYAWPILDTDTDRRWLIACTVATWVVWAIFAVDYAIRLALTTRRWRFVRRNLVDLVVIVLPLARPLRLLRLVTLVRVLNRQTAAALRGRIAVYVSGFAALVIFCAALAVLDAERKSTESNITTFPDALWWATTTVTTVGYGDRYPTTGEGRLVAAGLMLAGIALIGVLTASLAQWFVEQVQRSQETTRSELTELSLEIARLRQLLESASPVHRGTYAKRD